MGQDGGRNGVGAEVLVAARLETVTEVDDARPHLRDLQRDVDGLVAGLVDVLT